MSFINHYTKQIHCKILYSGPLGSGKTTNLQWLSRQLNKKDKNKEKDPHRDESEENSFYGWNHENENENKQEKESQYKTDVLLPFQLPTHPHSTFLFDFFAFRRGKGA